MTYGIVAAIAVVLGVLRWRRWQRRRESAAPAPVETAPVEMTIVPWAGTARDRWSDVRLVAKREIHERVRGRIFRAGTAVIVVIVVGAIILSAHHGSSAPTQQTVGVVGTLSAPDAHAIAMAALAAGDRVHIVSEPTLAAAESALRSNRIDVALVRGLKLVLNEPATASNSPADPSFIRAADDYLGLAAALQRAGLTPSQTTTVGNAAALPVVTLQPGKGSTVKTASIIGLVLLFFLLTQYCTWTLIGVMQEKTSRVVEVLLATLRPIDLLSGKLLGIGAVALGQATLAVAAALITSNAEGGHVLRGASTASLLSLLVGLFLGYALYSWLYAAAGSMAERQDQVQTLALPLSIPILISYIYAITTAAEGSASTLFKVLAYVPFSSSFAMPVLVALNEATPLEYVISVLISLAGIALAARLAATIYRRAILQTGGRIKWRTVLSSGTR